MADKHRHHFVGCAVKQRLDGGAGVANGSRPSRIVEEEDLVRVEAAGGGTRVVDGAGILHAEVSAAAVATGEHIRVDEREPEGDAIFAFDEARERQAGEPGETAGIRIADGYGEVAAAPGIATLRLAEERRVAGKDGGVVKVVAGDARPEKMKRLKRSVYAHAAIVRLLRWR